MKKHLLTLLSLFIVATLTAGAFEVPDYKFEEKGDYAKYSQDVIDCVDWLCATPFGQQVDKCNEAAKFLYKWGNGTPTVNILISPAFVPLSDDEPYYRVIYYGGWCRAALQLRFARGTISDAVSLADTPREELKAEALAGIRAVNKFYVMNKLLLPKNKQIEKFIKMDSQGKLEAYVASVIDKLKMP